MDFNFIIKKSVQDICEEVKKEDNMDLIKSDVLNPIIEHVIMQLYPYFFIELIEIHIIDIKLLKKLNLL